MSFITKFLGFLAVLILLIAILIGFKRYNEEQELEKIKIWAEQNKIEIDRSKIKSKEFKIKFDEKEWNLLKQKLELTRYFEPLTDVPRFDYGFDPEYSKELVDYWKTKFDWKLKVDYLNKYPQFKININDTIIHYVHFVTNKNIPNLKKVNLLLIDGWPGSFFGFYKMIDYINENFKDVSYDIIVPSIPGYGYSSPLNKAVGVLETSFLFEALMRFEFGEDGEYFIHGEDWGSIIASSMSQLFPNRIKGLHISLPLPPDFSDPVSLFYIILIPIFPKLILTEQEQKLNLSKIHSFNFKLKTALRETGYMHLQATKPDTLSQGLTDSPVGLLAYILEKYSSWSNDYETQIVGHRDGGLDKFDRDDLLTIVTYYWMTNSIGSSIRFYAKSISSIQNYPNLSKLKIPEQVPVAVQMFYDEVKIYISPKKILNLKYSNLTRYNILENGGHFAAFQNPKKTCLDFIEFINSV